MEGRGLLKLPNRAAAHTIADHGARISDPVERLRYVHACTIVAEQNSWFLRLRPIGSAIFRFLWLGARFRGWQAKPRRAPWSERHVFRLLRWRLTVIRHRRLTSALSGVLVCAVAVVIWVWFGGREPARVMEAAPLTESERAEVGAPHGPPAEIWLVESSDSADLYSNGLQVDNRYRPHTGPRDYAVLPRDGEVEPEALEWRERPVGLVLHTTESDLAPFAKAYNHHIRYHYCTGKNRIESAG